MQRFRRFRCEAISDSRQGGIRAPELVYIQSTLAAVHNKKIKMSSTIFWRGALERGSVVRPSAFRDYGEAFAESTAKVEPALLGLLALLLSHKRRYIFKHSNGDTQ